MAEEEKPQIEDEDNYPLPEEHKHHHKVEDSDDSDKKSDSGKRDSRWQRFATWYKADKRKSIPLTLVVVLLLLAALPISRYQAAGLVLKKDVVLEVNDATTKTPVSGAKVSLGAISGETDANGKVTLHHLAVGHHSASVTKKYYNDVQIDVFVPITSAKTAEQIAFTANGRQAKILVTDLLNGDKLNGADIKAAGVKSKTDETGSATIVVPAGVTSVKATISAKGYNDSQVVIQVTDKAVKENDFKLTPAGKVYFLSKLSGKIDVVKTNLDGSSRETVLGGTGFEEDRGTVLLASRDWKYLALKSRRDNGLAKLYLISTSDDSLAVMDQGNVTFNPVGWSDDNFIFTIDRNSDQPWTPNQHAIKSFSAANKQVTLLAQTKGSGTNYYDYQSESYGEVYQIGRNVIYDTIWSWGYNVSFDQNAMAQMSNTIYSISATGSSPQTLKTFSQASGGYNSIISVPYRADQIYYQVYSGDNKPTYYVYQNGKVAQPSGDISDGFREYQQSPVTYLQSPSGNSTFWAETRDGKYTLFIGDSSGNNGKQVATLSEYFTYGWYTDDYLLVSKNSSELYIIPKAGIKKDTEAIKITDYHKPTQSFQGYGGGYGGI